MKALVTTVLLGLIGLHGVQAQSESQFEVNYLLTYEAAKHAYTAWVVPKYATPNVHNGDSEERGATAQFALKTPKDFVISNVRDVRGTWEKAPLKMGNQERISKAGADPRFAYYVIGKAPTETNYGEFRPGEPVALFTFNGQGGDPTAVAVLEQNDPFVALADQQMSLNVGNSFYSRSGQAPLMKAKPLEQFSRGIDLQTVLRQLASTSGGSANDFTEGSDLFVMTYPNPVQQQLTVRFFSGADQNPIELAWINGQGHVLQTQHVVAKQGFNTALLTVSADPAGVYFVRLTDANKPVARRVLKE